MKEKIIKSKIIIISIIHVFRNKGGTDVEMGFRSMD